jgi:hypothetical protein
VAARSIPEDGPEPSVRLERRGQGQGHMSALSISIGRTLPVWSVDPTITTDPNITVLSMADKPFQHAQTRPVFADQVGSLIRQDPLIAVRLQKLADP